MNEEPKSIWKKSVALPKFFTAWLVLLCATTLVFSIILWFIGEPFKSLSDLTKTFIASLIIATGAFCLWLFVRWLGCWRNFKKFLFALACFATLIALFYAEEDWRGWHAWNQFKKEWMAKGEKFDFKDFIPPPVPDDQNFALTPVVASCYEAILDKRGHKLAKWNTNVVNRLDFDLADDYGNRTNGNGYWAKGTLTDLKPRLELFAAKTNLFPMLRRSSSPAADVLLALGKYNATVEELRQASLLPESRFPLNYDIPCPADILLPQLAAMKKSALLLQLRAIAELQNGQSDKALADVKLTLRLTDAIRTEPFLISHLVRIAMTDIILQPIYEGLANHQWTDAQLVALDAELAKLDFLADYKFSMRGEMGMQSGVIEYLRHHPEEILDMGSESNDGNFSSNLPRPARFVWQLIPSGWFYQNALHSCRFMVRNYLPVADVGQQLVFPAAVKRASNDLAAEFKTKNPYNLLERMLIPALANAVKKFTREQISVDMTRTAIALERYRLAHGEFPESLVALAPPFISEVPHDVIGGQPLKYRRTDGGQFVLYSVGWNEKDDGGVTGYRKGSSAPDFDSGDWVWRYPKAEGIIMNEK